ncbi:MAG: hypothetical protein Tsb0013_12440 [Phycisphaerales bacterium]
MHTAHCAAVVACAAFASAANAGISVTQNLTDAEVNALTSGLIAWEAEGRFGDRGGAAERELGVGASTAQPQADEAQVNWANNIAPPVGYTGYDYTITWDGLSVLTLDVTGVDATGAPVIENLVYNLPDPAAVTDVYIRVAGNDFATSALSWEIDGMAGTQIAGLGAAVNSVQTRISGSQLTDGFVLSGVFTFAWTDASLTNSSRPSWQIKAAVPAPGAAVLAFAAGASTLRRRRRS